MKIVCFGTVSQLLVSCKCIGVTNAELIGKLTRAIDPNSDYGAADSSTISRLLNCKRNLSKGHISDIVSLARTADKANVAAKIESTVLPLIDEDEKDALMRALNRLVSGDRTLKKASFEKYAGGQPRSLAELIAGLLIYSCAAVPNLSGNAHRQTRRRGAKVRQPTGACGS